MDIEDQDPEEKQEAGAMTHKARAADVEASGAKEAKLSPEVPDGWGKGQPGVGQVCWSQGV